jgi:hypothetical protein
VLSPSVILARLCGTSGSTSPRLSRRGSGDQQQRLLSSSPQTARTNAWCDDDANSPSKIHQSRAVSMRRDCTNMCEHRHFSWASSEHNFHINSLSSLVVSASCHCCCCLLYGCVVLLVLRQIASQEPQWRSLKQLSERVTDRGTACPNSRKHDGSTPVRQASQAG